MRDTRHDVLTFWFEETQPAQWFQKNPEFDALVRTRFEPVYEDARAGKFEHWQSDADGALALCVIFDQFPRNMFRDTARSYATDDQALLVAKRAVHLGLDQVVVSVKRRFIYLPFEHSEKFADQKRSLELFTSLKKDDPISYEYAVRHYQVIERFGRFPHRNAILGRANTPEEDVYLSENGYVF
jgi:uncharacterized protein (DUF924 family)